MTFFTLMEKPLFFLFEQLLIMIRERGELAVTLDDLLETFDGDLDGGGGVLAHVLIEASLFALLVPDNVEAGAAAAAERGGDDEHCGGLHFACLDAKALPALPLLQKLVVDGALFRRVRAVVAVLALDDAGVGAVAELFGCLTKGEGDVEIGDGGELDGRVFERGVLVADGAGGDDDVAGLDV